MKLRISNNKWRFRVNKKDLQNLLDGENIELISKLPNSVTVSFVVSLNNEPAPHIKKQNDCYKIIFPLNEISLLTNKLPDKQGVVFDLPVGNDTFQLIFQVDVRGA